MTGKIKVIKRKSVAEPAEPVVDERKTKRQAAREAVTTVKNWVSEFQTRKRKETSAAIEAFLPVKPQPIEG